MKLILVISLFLVGCKSSDTTFHFSSIGWTVTVPDSLMVEDSSLIYRTLPKAEASPENTPYDGVADESTNPPVENSVPAEPYPTTQEFPEKLLLRVMDNGGWNLNSNKLLAATKPLAKGVENWQAELQIVRNEFYSAFTRDFLPKVEVDSIFSQETIDGLLFDKSYFKAKGATATNYTEIYSKIINGKQFHCVIHYSDPVRGQGFIDIFKESRFKQIR